MSASAAAFAHNLRRFRLITFDLTDTLLSFRRAPEAEYARAVQQLGYGACHDLPAMRAAFGTQFRQLAAVAPNFGRDGRPQLTWENWWRRLIAGVLRSDRPDLDDRAVRRIADHLIDLYETGECWQKTRGAEDLLRAVRQLEPPLAMGVISNFDPRLKWLVENVRLPAFDLVLASYEVGAEKPSPQIFDLALRLAGEKLRVAQDLRPEEALHVGNTARLDYVGARAAGWSSVLITNGEEGAVERAVAEGVRGEHVFGSLEEFRERLERGGGGGEEMQWD